MSKKPKAKASAQKPTAYSTEIAIESNLTEVAIIDNILTSKLSGEINSYRNLLTDTTVFGSWTQRQSGLVQMERQVIPADADNAADVAAAEFIKTQLENLCFDKILKAMQWGVYYGYAVSEVMWDVIDGKVVIDDILVRDRGNFKFDKDKKLQFTANDKDESMPDAKFWTYNAGGDTTDNPYGLGLAHYLFWVVLFKKSNIKFWLLGLEKAATTVPHVQYDPRARDPEAERQKALTAGIGIKNGSAIATAQGTTVELLKGISGTDDYETLCKYMDEAIALVILGQVMTSQAVGGQYKAEVQNQVKEDIVKADADLICSSFNNTVIKWLTEWNFPNANPPKLWLLSKDEADELKQTQAWANMANVGYRPTLETVEATFGGTWESVYSAQTPSPNDAGQGAADDFAEGDDAPTSLVDTVADQLGAEVAPEIDAWILQIKQKLDAADSLETLRDELNDLAGKLTFEQYALIFEQANITAKLAGMSSAIDEAGEDDGD